MKINAGTEPRRSAVGYARVSTVRQATEGVSLDAQRAKIQAWCAASDHQLEGVHVDEGLSGGRSDNRPALKAALNAVCARAGSALVVYSLSRLARSVRDTLDIAERLDRAGAELVSVTENIDTTSPAGRMVFRLLAVLAEFERELISHRTAEALGHKKACGQRVGTVPFGYRVGGDGVTLEAVGSELAVIGRIRQMREQGRSLRSIAAQLEAEGVAAKQGKRWHHRVIADLCTRTEIQVRTDATALTDRSMPGHGDQTAQSAAATGDAQGPGLGAPGH